MSDAERKYQELVTSFVAVAKTWKVQWDDDELAALDLAKSALVGAVLRMVCADPLHQTAEERRAVVAYLDAMTAEIKSATP